jgi:hypothetical protein
LTGLNIEPAFSRRLEINRHATIMANTDTISKAKHTDPTIKPVLLVRGTVEENMSLIIYVLTLKLVTFNRSHSLITANHEMKNRQFYFFDLEDKFCDHFQA